MEHSVDREVKEVGGGSSSYYDFELDGKIIKTGDIIRYMFGNDFDFGNCLKALKRIYEQKRGGGKDGVSIQYDINKIHYFLEEIKKGD